MNICKNCKSCLDKNRHGDEYQYNVYCRKHVNKTDSVFGTIEYDNCYNRNPDGNCKEYEPSLLFRVKQFFGL